MNLKRKSTFFFLFFFVLNVFAQSEEKNITLIFSDIPLSEAVQIIEKNSKYTFFYDALKIDLTQKVSLKANNISIKEAISRMLADSNIRFEISNFQIALFNERESSSRRTKQISGIVVDRNGEPVIGATIMANDTRKGTVSDINGSFKIDVPEDGKINVSFIGYASRSISVKENTFFRVILQEDSKTLDELVVVGYGTMKRSDLTGAVSSISASSLKDIPVTSAAQAITGKLAGVQVTQTEGAPDAEIKIRIRGGGSITQDNSPLYIVDGFPVDGISDIAPTDIESIDVLKDASSTAIYGARGANGVIIITTKSGSEGKTKVSYNMYSGIKKITGYYDVLDPYEYVLWQYEVQRVTNPLFERYFGDYKDLKLYKDMKGTNWQKEVFGKTGTSLYNNLSVTGGGKDVKYNLSLTRNDEEEIMIGSGYNRTNFAGKTNYLANKWLSFDLSLRLSDYNLKGAGTYSNGRLPHIVQFRPVNGLIDLVDADLFDDDLEIFSTTVLNPLKQTNDDYRLSNTQTSNYNGAMNIKFMKNLIYRFDFGTQYTKRIDNRFYGINTSNAYQYGMQPLAEKTIVTGKSYRISNVLTYSLKDFLPNNNLSVMIGEELFYSKSDFLTTSVKYLPKHISYRSALAMMNLGISDPILTTDGTPMKISSFLGRLNYDYKSKYIVTLSYRADGSSKFAPGNQWGYFPSAGLAWRISDESFMTASRSWVDGLKIRLSYGKSGNSRISDDAWKKTFTVRTGWLFIDGNEEVQTAYLSPDARLSNPFLKWETTITRNIGIDFSVLNNRLSGTIELYKNTTKDLLISATIPASSGYSMQWQNIGQTSNRGVEFSLASVLIQQKDFRLSLSGNIAFNVNRIDKLGETKSWEQSSGWADSDGPSGDYLIKEGGKIGLMYGYQTEGMYSVDDFYYDYGTGTYTLKEGVSDNSGLIGAMYFGPGSLKLVNQNPEEGTSVDANNDKVVIGDANPIHTGGFTLNAVYKGFDMSAFFNWVYGNGIYNANKLNFTDYRGSRAYKNLLSFMDSESRFMRINPETGNVVKDPDELAELNKNKSYWQASMSRTPLHSWAIEDGSFLRLNNLTVGYSLPKKVLTKLKIEQFRFYLTAYNLWLWTKYTGYDPEVDAVRSTPLTPGIDYNAYPRSRNFNIGLNLTF